MTADDLARFRERIPGCEMVVFADIQTNTVLASNGAFKFPQEHMDELCDDAALLFSGVFGFRDDNVDSAVLVNATGCRTFVRSALEPSEVLCSVVAAQADAEHVVDESRLALRTSPENWEPADA